MHVVRCKYLDSYVTAIVSLTETQCNSSNQLEIQCFYNGHIYGSRYIPLNCHVKIMHAYSSDIEANILVTTVNNDRFVSYYDIDMAMVISQLNDETICSERDSGHDQHSSNIFDVGNQCEKVKMDEGQLSFLDPFDIISSAQSMSITSEITRIYIVHDRAYKLSSIELPDKVTFVSAINRNLAIASTATEQISQIFLLCRSSQSPIRILEVKCILLKYIISCCTFFQYEGMNVHSEEDALLSRLCGYPMSQTLKTPHTIVFLGTSEGYLMWFSIPSLHCESDSEGGSYPQAYLMQRLPSSVKQLHLLQGINAIKGQRDVATHLVVEEQYYISLYGVRCKNNSTHTYYEDDAMCIRRSSMSSLQPYRDCLLCIQDSRIKAIKFQQPNYNSSMHLEDQSTHDLHIQLTDELHIKDLHVVGDQIFLIADTGELVVLPSDRSSSSSDTVQDLQSLFQSLKMGSNVARKVASSDLDITYLRKEIEALHDQESAARKKLEDLNYEILQISSLLDSWQRCPHRYESRTDRDIHFDSELKWDCKLESDVSRNKMLVIKIICMASDMIRVLHGRTLITSISLQAASPYDSTVSTSTSHFLNFSKYSMDKNSSENTYICIVHCPLALCGSNQVFVDCALVIPFVLNVPNRQIDNDTQSVKGISLPIFHYQIPSSEIYAHRSSDVNEVTLTQLQGLCRNEANSFSSSNEKSSSQTSMDHSIMSFVIPYIHDRGTNGHPSNGNDSAMGQSSSTSKRESHRYVDICRHINDILNRYDGTKTLKESTNMIPFNNFPNRYNILMPLFAEKDHGFQSSPRGTENPFDSPVSVKSFPIKYSSPMKGATKDSSSEIQKSFVFNACNISGSRYILPAIHAEIVTKYLTLLKGCLSEDKVEIGSDIPIKISKIPSKNPLKSQLPVSKMDLPTKLQNVSLNVIKHSII